MLWSDITRPPTSKVLRQFGALCLLIATAFFVWRNYRGQVDGLAIGVLTVGMVIGLAGLLRPMTIRYVFTGWMMLAFPIGWTISKLVLALMFFAMFTPIAWLFRLIGRDALRLRRPSAGSLWADKPAPRSARDYFRQF